MTETIDRPGGSGWAGDAILFVALLATAIALGGALAHLFELPNKIGMPEADYFTTQQAYAGWNRLAWVLLVELAGMIGVIVVVWRSRAARISAVLAIAFLVAAQAVFWTFTFPANVATDNWASIPPDWQGLRARWEYSHAAGALFQLAAFSALAIAVLRYRRA